MDKDTFDRIYAERLNAIQSRVDAVLQNPFVQFSAYAKDDDGLPVDSLDWIAVKGKVRLIQEHDSCSQGQDYSSEVLEDPTWLEIAIHANEMIQTTGNHHHVFLETLDLIERHGDVAIFEFWMGS